MNTYANPKPNYCCFLNSWRSVFLIEVFGKLWETFLHSLLPFCLTLHRQSKHLSLDIPYLAGSRLEVGWAEETTDGCDEQEGPRGGWA